MRFRKYHGIGNDFVLLEDVAAAMGPAGSLPRDLVAALCDRHTGIGADGVIRIIGADADPETASADAALRMDYYNADGGPAEMCGNGIRCLAVLAHRIGCIEPGPHRVLTGAGVLTVVLDPDGRTVSVDMGEPRLDRADVPMAGDGPALRVGVETRDGTVEGTGVSMGNPHFVVFTADLGRAADDELVRGLGPAIECHPAFPKRTNVEFVDVLSEEEISMRVWERGVGETLACGTGACAAAVASAALGRTKRRVAVRLPGGTLDVLWGEDGRVWMTGGAEEVFEGVVDPAWIAARGLTLP